MTDLFDFKPKPSSFAVMGNPVAHSKSPQIHSLFARQLDISMSYERIQVDVGGFDQAVSHFTAHGGAGLNITVPFKVEAWKLCQKGNNELSARAEQAEAVNTLKFRADNTVYGDNTDGAGIVADIENNIGLSLANSRVLIVGAGGAVRGILGPIIEREPSVITIANRTSSKASELVDRFSGSCNTSLQSSALEEDGDGEYDLIINGTAASLDNSLPGLPENCLSSETVIYDMMYSQQPTIFMQWALSNGAKQAYDGLGMLVEQAAESFYQWHGMRPQTAAVIEAIRKI
jgi:shikimate dehydrogenase